MALYYNGRKVKNLYYNGRCLTRLALGEEMTKLVEGDDFVRAEWLCGRNGAYINTGYVPIPIEDFFMFKINNNGFWKNPNNDDPHVFGVYSPRIRFGTFASAENRYFFQYSNVVGGIAPYFTSPDYIQEVTLLNDGTKTKCIANGIVSEYETTITEQFNDSIWLYAINNAPSKYFHGDIAYFNIEPNKVRMTPVRLLRPIPATLDGNGIARNADECGMYNSVNGLFYGNVGSGTFTVEPSLVEGVDYERHRWLKGDGIAFIRTDKTINIGDEVDCLIIPINDIPADLNWKFVYGNDGGDNPYTFMCVIFSSNSMRFRHKRAFTSYISNEIYSIKHSISNVFVNGTELTYESEANYTESSRTLMLFNSSNSNTNYVFSGYIGNFSLSNKLNLVPVRLLRPLPSYLDANGKNRNQFECGMLDLKTKKFYGNFNTSGKFTVSDD